MHDVLGTRMKEWYENRCRYYLPRRTYTILRVDGKAFHTWTKGLDRPFDVNLLALMDETTRQFCKQVQGAIFAYTQSDEVSVLIADFDPTGEKYNTEAWFNGNIQKLCSVGASTFTSIFNEIRGTYIKDKPPATFDARVFTIPDPVEVYNYFVWRQKDAIRNSVQAASHMVFTSAECLKKNTTELKAMLLQKGIDWETYSVRQKLGRCIFFDRTEVKGEALNQATGEKVEFIRSLGWSLHPAIPHFSSYEGRNLLNTLIPKRSS